MEERRFATLFIDPGGGYSDFNWWSRLDDTWWSVAFLLNPYQMNF